MRPKEIPENATYGVYDTENAEWTGHWFYDEASAQKAAEELRDNPRLGVVSTTDDEDWLE